MGGFPKDPKNGLGYTLVLSSDQDSSTPYQMFIQSTSGWLLPANEQKGSMPVEYWNKFQLS